VGVGLGGASGRREFVSSLIRDMPEERAAVRATIEAVGAAVVIFDDLGAQDISVELAYLSRVRSSIGARTISNKS